MRTSIGCLFGVTLCFALVLLDFREVRAQALDLSAAQKAFQAKDWSKVIELLGPNVEKLQGPSLHQLAESYSQVGNSGSAIRVYSAALTLNPKDAPAKRKIGLEHLKSGNQREALNAFREAIEINPRYEAAYLDMANLIEEREKRNAKASQKFNWYDIKLLYEDLVAKVGRRPQHIAKLCEIMTLDGQHTKSIEYCNEGIKLNAREPRNYVHLAMTQKEIGKMKEARANFEKAAKSFSKSEFAQLAAARFFVEQKNHMAAYTYFKRAVEASPESIPAMFGLAKSSLELQKYEEAHQVLTEACKHDRAAYYEIRQAMTSLRQQKNTEWFDKFDTLSTTCRSMN